MKQFFKFMFASMLGVMLSIVILFFITVAFVSMLVTSAASEKTVKPDPGSVLHIFFKAPLKDRDSGNPFEDMDFGSISSTGQPGLNEIIKGIEKASYDPNIDGIYLDLSGLRGGYASIEEVRNALLEFKNSKKFIYAYSDFYSQGSYYLATAADQVWLNPEGAVDFRGLSAQLPFLKGLFGKLEIEPQIIRHGKFKSAIEPLILDKMSDENREQTASYVNALWNHYLAEVSVSRKLHPDRLKNMADSMLLRTAEDALRLNMVDKTGYKDEFLALLKQNSDNDKEDDAGGNEFISLKKYTHAVDHRPAKEFTRDKIAVVYASGNIVSGKGKSDQIGSETISEAIRKAREDKKVKAVVLRVNSGGGDALASEVIWREMHLCRKEKPVVVSMGDVAASGGYYISCAADSIVAQPNTITGSIGVFGVIFNAQNMFNHKLGITFDGYKTSPFADIGSGVRPLTDSERNIIQQSVERVYATFTKRVSEGRKMDLALVDSIGQGRVWSGVDALNIGLVDVLGGLNDAIDIASRLAKIDTYRISELPEKKDPFTQLMEEIKGEAEIRLLKYRMGSQYEYFDLIRDVYQLQGIQARSFVNADFN